MKNTDATNPLQLNRRSWFGRMTAVTVSTVLGGTIARGNSPTPVNSTVKRTRSGTKRQAGSTMPMGFDEPMF